MLFSGQSCRNGGKIKGSKPRKISTFLAADVVRDCCVQSSGNHKTQTSSTVSISRTITFYEKKQFISELTECLREIRGLKKIHKRLSTQPIARRACPHSVDSERVLSSIKKIISEHSSDGIPKNIIMPTIIHYTHEEPPSKVQERCFLTKKIF